MDLTEIVYEMEWIELHQKGVQWQVLLNAAENLLFTLKVKYFMSRYATSSFSMRILLNRVSPSISCNTFTPQAVMIKLFSIGRIILLRRGMNRHLEN
jgi:hypothetical protein